MTPRRRFTQLLSWTLVALCAACLILTAVLSFPKTRAAAYPVMNRSMALKDISFPSQGVDVNAAGLEALDTLPGIGPVTAQAILEERENNGPFFYPEDLLGVKGIGEKTLDKLRDRISLE